VRRLSVDFLGGGYQLDGLNLRLVPHAPGREYLGWIKSDDDVLPFIVSFGQYNSERKIYPVRVALSTGGDALIANVALEGTSKMPIDFIVKGDVPDAEKFGRIFNLDWSDVPPLSLNVAGGVDRKKIIFRKSSLFVRGTDFMFLGEVDWSKKNLSVSLNLSSSMVDLSQLFPELYKGSHEQRKKKLDVFKNIPLFADEFLDRDVNFGFSGGEVKRSEILQLLAQMPDFTMFDEPDSGVDIENVELIASEIGTLLDKDKPQRSRVRSGLLITHLGYILNFVSADKAHVLMDGRISCSGNPTEILEDIRKNGFNGCVECAQCL
jgi:Fe-S cluster assembly ATP-binding protein